MSDYTLKVSTEALREASTEVYARVNNSRAAFDEIRDIINSSRAYWEGKGNEAYISSFSRKTERINEALRRFEENAADLEKMAGVYDSAERKNTASSSAIPTNLIS